MPARSMKHKTDGRSHDARDLGRRTFAEILPFGPAPTLVILLTIITGALLWGPVALDKVGLSMSWLPRTIAPPGRSVADVEMMTFAATHFDAYRGVLRENDRYVPASDLKGREDEARHRRAGRTIVDLTLVNMNAVSRKLQAAFRAGIDVADIVEVENTVAGTFFRGPPGDIPFHDIGKLLRQTTDEAGRSLYDRMVGSRFALYSHEGVLYGLPHDLHPVMIAYRRDIFEAERDRVIKATGIDPLKGQLTWPEFVAIGRALTEPGKRYMLQVSERSEVSFEVLLYQRGGDFFNADGEVTFDSPIGIELLQWMIPLTVDQRGEAGGRIFDNAGGGGPAFYRNVGEGFILAFFCPDWRSGVVEFNAPDLAGRLALMPLPIWPDDPRQRRTSTQGGTMLGLTRRPDATRSTDDAERAATAEREHRRLEQTWQTAQMLYFNVDLLAKQFRETNIIPPFKDAWRHPVFQERRDYWSGQRIGRLYTELAEELPTRNGSPFLELAKAKVGAAIASSAAYYREHGDRGFDAFAEQRLKAAADEVRLQMKRNPF